MPSPVTKLRDRVAATTKIGLRRTIGDNGLSYVHAAYWAARLATGRFHKKEFDFLGRFVGPGDACLDIGGNFGQFASQLAKHVGPSGRVMCFEPVPYTRGVLTRVLSLLRVADRVDIIDRALSDREGVVSMAIPTTARGDRNLGEAHIAVEGETGEAATSIQTCRLDELAGVPRPIAFIKCDVEGAELMAMRGARSLLEQDRPVVLCEIEARHTARYDYTPADVFALFSELGYRASIALGSELAPVDGPTATENNYFFVPESVDAA